MLRILYTIVHDREMQKWLVFQETVNPAFGYAFGTLQGDLEQKSEFDSKQAAIDYVLNQSSFERFVLTDLNHKV